MNSCILIILIYLAETSTTSNVLKKTRRKTTGKGMIEMIASNSNKKVEVIFDSELWVLNTEFSNKKFTTAIGIEIRNRGPVCIKEGLRKIDDETKLKRCQEMG